MDMTQTQIAIGENAMAKGFWKAHEKLDSLEAAAYCKLALIHSEVSEAVEALRTSPLNPGMEYGDDGKPEGLWSEVADVIIRCLDFAEWGGVNIADVIQEKMEYNTKREAMHGRKA